MTIIVPQVWRTWDRVKAACAPGRKRGVTAGSHVTDKAELKKSIVLCAGCYWKFDYKRRGYYSIFKFEGVPVRGRCDACKEDGGRRHLYLHEASVDRSWLRKDVARQMLRIHG